ncbi:MAG: hypothetical protein OK474_10680 [Thaumarchaeota archaeon]|nr:hypothetical protein [Nitrososphaerota archaeon]
MITLALTAAATFLSTKTIVRPDIGSVTFGFPLTWLSISHGFINLPPSWMVDLLGLTGDLVTWFVVSIIVVYLWSKVGVGSRGAKLSPTGRRTTT